MEGRTTQNYVNVLKKIKNILKINPDIAMSDFEKAEQKALRTVFPNKIIGYFHYSQALVHNAEKHGILKNDKNGVGWGATKLLISLAFLPKKLIVEGFNLISGIIFQDCTYLQSFFQYYKDTWINSFKPESFSVFQQIHRTNNVSKRHNRELRLNLKKHTTIAEFFVYLSEHQKRIRSFARHPQFWARTKRYSLKEKENEILKIWNTIENDKDLDLLLILHKLSELVGQ
ncbi:uncharacterized protein LOC114254812 [Monomorium pharaonis]|uniref:uncharacterized protein LOC114254812 n=1 Tax=Monomorium pharaonis TaxID=307658 RepID=UPI001746A873|nr:uncharacterized protein LOC114254812 [Monomorium pharaonis]